MNPTLSQHVGQRIRELREARQSLDTFEVAITINEHQAAIDLYESGKSEFVFYDMLEKLAKYFNVPVAYFFEGFES